MASESFQVLDTFIADGSVATYTSLEHTEALSRGRSASYQLTATNYDNDTYLTVVLENSVDGQNFQSKYTTYLDGVLTIVPLVAAHKLVHTVGNLVIYPITDTVVATEPPPALPNHRHARLRIQLMNLDNEPKSARIVVHATIRGTPPIADVEERAPTAPRPAPPGSLARHEQMLGEVQDLANRASGLPQAHRAAFILTNLSSGTKEHMRAVEGRIQRLPAHVRSAIVSSTTENVRQAIALSGGSRQRGEEKGACCEPEISMSVESSKGPCGGCNT